MKVLVILAALGVAACSARTVVFDEEITLEANTFRDFISQLRFEASQQDYILILVTPEGSPGDQFSLVINGQVSFLHGRRILASDLEDINEANRLIALSRRPGYKFTRYSTGDRSLASPPIPIPITTTTTTPRPLPPITPPQPQDPTRPPWTPPVVPPGNPGTLPPKIPGGPGGRIYCDDWLPTGLGRTYKFGYSVNHPLTGDIKCHKESRDGDFAEGVYSLVEPDGNLRTVTYTSDKGVGFIANVQRTYGVAEPAPEYPNHPWRVIVAPGIRFSPTVQREDGRW